MRCAWPARSGKPSQKGSARAALISACWRLPLLWVGLAAILPAQQTAQEHASRGLELARTDLAAAESELREAARLSPGNAVYLSDLASILRMQKRPAEAVGYYRKALKADAGNAAVRRNLALALWDCGDLRAAGEELQALLKTQAGDRLAILMLGMVEQDLGQHARAVTLLESVHDLVKQRPESVSALVQACYQSGRKEQARRSVDLLLAGEPRDPRPLFDSARQAFAAGDFDISERLLQRIISAGFLSGPVYNLLGRCFWKTGRLKAGGEAFDQAIQLEPSNEENYLDLIRMLASRNEWRPALEAAQKAAVKFPGSGPLLEVKGLAESMLLLTEDSIASYNRALKIDPRSARANLGLAAALWAAGSVEEATAAFERGIREFPGDALHYQEYGRLQLSLAKGGDAAAESRAVAMFEKAIAVDSSLSEAHYELGNLAMNKGRIPAALNHLERARKLEPDLSKIRYALSRAYRRAGRSAEAAEELRAYQRLKAVEQTANPGFPAVSAQRQ